MSAANQVILFIFGGDLFLQSGQASTTFSLSVDVRSKEESDQVEERDPGIGWQVFLRKDLGLKGVLIEEGYQSKWADHPGNLHDGEESDFDGRLDLLNRFGSGCCTLACRDKGHAPMTAIEAR